MSVFASVQRQVGRLAGSSAEAGAHGYQAVHQPRVEIEGLEDEENEVGGSVAVPVVEYEMVSTGRLLCRVAVTALTRIGD